MEINASRNKLGWKSADVWWSLCMKSHDFHLSHYCLWALVSRRLHVKLAAIDHSWNVSVLKNMVSHCTHDLAQNLLPQMPDRHDTVWWWVKLSDSRLIHPYLNTDPVVKLLTRYIGLYDLNRKCSCFYCLSHLFENSLNAKCIHAGQLSWFLNENIKYDEISWSQHGCRLISLSKAFFPSSYLGLLCTNCLW